LEQNHGKLQLGQPVSRPSREFNPEPPEYEAAMINTSPQHSILKANYIKIVYKWLQCRQYKAVD
jgi:hypothetical protein